MNDETVREHDVRVYGVDPYILACTLCDAAVGQLCAVDGRNIGAPHETRIRAARELRQYELALPQATEPAS